jgi:hypothetical protein
MTSDDLSALELDVSAAESEYGWDSPEADAARSALLAARVRGGAPDTGRFVAVGVGVGLGAVVGFVTPMLLAWVAEAIWRRPSAGDPVLLLLALAVLLSTIGGAVGGGMWASDLTRSRRAARASVANTRA